ncbi:MAG: HAMP domain-containing histidine kinase, partial [Bryobacteraceae bacterium]|nr:HAMP domain-containing histidine kinase [Bryobacteraceae bacterium]
NIYRASRQVLLQLDDLLALTRGSAPAAENCRLSEIVEDAWGSVAAQAEAASVHFLISGDTSVETSVSRSRIERVFVNLFANALQAMPGGGEVNVRIEGDDESASVIVHDTGPGVPKQIRESLFQPFTTLGKSNGLGLGLALSRQTVLEHGGDLILLESPQGARFRVLLPLRSAVTAA